MKELFESAEVSPRIYHFGFPLIPEVRWPEDHYLGYADVSKDLEFYFKDKSSAKGGIIDFNSKLICES